MIWTMPVVAIGWACVLTATLGWTGWRVAVAGAAERDAAVAGEAIARQIDRLQQLRRQGAAVSYGPRPDGDLVSRVQRALTDAGLPVAAASGVQPRGEQQASTPGVHIQGVQLRLHGLNPAEFGAWMAAWRAVPQPWHCDGIQFTHAAAGVPPADGGSLDSNRFDITVDFSAPYVEDTR